MPVLTMAALINVDTGLGASTWARGNHTWKGTTPALTANPRAVTTNTAERPDGGIAAPRSALNSSPPAAAASPTRPSRIATRLRWVITAYHRPASATSARRRG